jgi:energy-coupling factor transporter ATP-binding protein EcfA2
MRLKQFSVTNFRSITKAEKLPLGDFTVLIGPNNEGKSNILEALAIGMQGLSNPRTQHFRGSDRRRFRTNLRGAEQFNYVWERDFPQSLQDNENGKTTLSFDFELTPEEVEDFRRTVGSKFNELLPISLTFGQKLRPIFKVRKQGPSQKALREKRDEIADFLADRVQLQYVPPIRTGNRVSDIVQRMLSRELTRAADEDAEYSQALEKIRELQEPIFASLSDAIVERLQSFLPDVKAVSIDTQGEDRSLPRNVSITVDDGVPTDLSFKGDGVQSLAAMAMMQHYSRETARAREFILAVEEPEAHLHPRAIHALKETLRETADTQQVILTTHSPLLANRLDLRSNIIVTKNKAAPAKSVQELRDVLGVSVADNMASAEVFLVVEGETDRECLTAVLAVDSSLARVLNDGLLRLVPLTGAGKLSYLLTQLQDSLASTHAFLDSDQAGREAAKAAQDAGLLRSVDVTMAMRQGEKTGCELEDLIEPGVYEDAFMETFGVSVANHAWINKMSKGKWSARMPHIFQSSGKSWSKPIEEEAKKVVAAAAARVPETAIRVESRPLIDALTEALKAKIALRAA